MIEYECECVGRADAYQNCCRVKELEALLAPVKDPAVIPELIVVAKVCRTLMFQSLQSAIDAKDIRAGIIAKKSLEKVQALLDRVSGKPEEPVASVSPIIPV